MNIDAYKAMTGLYQRIDKLIELQQKHLDLLTNKPIVVPAKTEIIDTNVKHVQSSAVQDAMINRKEVEEFGGDMSATELAALFGEDPVEEKEVDFSKMTKQEIDEWQKSQDDSTDIYKVKARVTNLARASGGGLTPNGEQLCNLYIHVLKSLYDFAKTINDKKIKSDLIDLIRKNEDMPANLINVSGFKR